LAIAEVAGILASEFKNLGISAKNIIMDYLNKMARKFGGKNLFRAVSKDADVVKVLNRLSEAMRAGEAITAEDLRSGEFEIKTGVERDVEQEQSGDQITDPVSTLKERKIGAFTMKYTENDKIDQFVKDGLVNVIDDISEFDGMTGMATFPDDMFSGEAYIGDEVIFEAGGGIYFVLKYGDVWAFGKPRFKKQDGSIDEERGRKMLDSKVEEMNRLLKENNGRLLIPLVKGTDKKLFSSPSGARASMIISEQLLKRGLISKSDFRKAAFNAIKEKGGDISLSGSSDQMISQFDEYMKDQTSTTFEVRGLVSKMIISNLSKSEKFKENQNKIIDFIGAEQGKNLTFDTDGKKSQSFLQSIANVFREPITKGLETGHVYGVIEVNSEVAWREDSHESYPIHIYTKDGSKPILHLPKSRVLSKESLITTSTNKPTGVTQATTVSVRFDLKPSKKEEAKKVKQRKASPEKFVSELEKTKASDPTQYWSVDSVSLSAAKKGKVC
jgi:hypothetical protein